MFLEECKCVVKEKKIPKYIIDNINISYYSDRENSDDENSKKETFDEETSDKKNSDEESFLFFLYIKMTNNHYKKKQRKASKRSTRKVPKSF